jgi:hypothetical protein
MVRIDDRIDDRINKNIKQMYKRFVVSYFYDAFGKITPNSDFIKKRETRIGTDFDKTLTAIGSITAYKAYISYLKGENRRIEIDYPILEGHIDRIDNSPSDFSGPLTDCEEFMRHCRLRKKEHKAACEKVVDSNEIKIIPDTTQALIELGNRGGRPGIFSGSQRDVIVGISEKKIGVEEPYIVATEIEWDSDGYFLRFRLNLGANRAYNLSNLYMNDPYGPIYCNYSITAEPERKEGYIYVTDDLSGFEMPTIVKIGSWGGVVVHVGEQQAFDTDVPEFVVNDTSVRKSALNLIKHFDLYQEANTFAEDHEDPRDLKQIIETSDEIKSMKIPEDKTYDKAQLEKFCNKTLKFISINERFPVFRTSIKSRVSELMYKTRTLSLKTNQEIFNRDVNEILQLIAANDPAPHITQKRREEYYKIISLLN